MTREWQRPVTDAQLGIWLGQQMDIASPRYNAAEAIELRGVLNTSCFQQALNEVVANSISLQLRFKQTENGPQQTFNQFSHVDNIAQLEQLDFSQHGVDGRDESAMDAAQAWMQQDLAVPVDLQQGPLFKQALLKLGENHHLWYQRIHHIACDGFAFALLTQQLAERYSELLANKTSQSAIKIEQQLKCFELIAVENSAYLQSPALAKDRAYWRDALNRKNIKADEMRSSFGTASFSRASAAPANTHLRNSSYISAEQLAQLQRLTAPLGLTWSDFLLACVAQLLYRQTAAATITLGIPVMNRMGSASLRIPAMVMNIIPLPINLQGITTTTALAQAISQQLKKSRPHQRYRYEQLKHDLGIGSTQKLFGPVVNIMPFDRPLGFSGLQAHAHNLSAGPVEDISFAFVLENKLTANKCAPESCLRFDLDANPNRYTKTKLNQIQQEFHGLLHQILQNPDAPLSVDKQQLSWLEGKCLAAPTHSVLHSIYQQMCAQPAAIALQQDDETLTYQQLAAHSASLAISIADMGVVPRCVIALILPRSTEAISAALACWLLDCTFVFLDPEAPQTRNALIIANAQPALVILDKITPDFSELLTHTDSKLVSLPYLRKTQQPLASEQFHPLWQRATQKKCAQAHAPAYLIYTSGSTGTPKGVVIGHQALAEFVASNQDSYQIQRQDRVLQFAPLHFDACIEEIFVTLSQGARLVLRNSAMLESMPIFLQQCAQWQITLLDLPTAFWHELAFACKHLALALPEQLRAIIIGGEAVMPERVAQWHTCFGESVALFNTYGPSEATVIATCVNLCSAEQLNQNLPITIGSPLSGRALAVVDENLQLLPKGEEGELLLTGLPASATENELTGGLADGYLHLPEKNVSAFIQLALPWQEKTLRAYRTGDRVKINACNQVEFIGRLDDQIKISGYRIDPLEIEAALIKLNGVREAAVVAIAKGHQEKTLVAHVVSDHLVSNCSEGDCLEGDCTASNKHADKIKQLRSQLKHLLPAPMLPSAVIYHQQLAKNASGKINRAALQEQSIALLNAGSNQTEALTAQVFTTQQNIIRTIWQEVLGQHNIQLDDDFFALGGQSLQCIQVANRLSAKLQRDIPVAWLFQHPSIQALDVLLNESTNTYDADALSNQSHQLMAQDCADFSRNLPAANQHATNPPLRKLASTSRCILLTGATGFVGAQLLAQLVKTGNKIICLVRAADQTSARRRLLEACKIQLLHQQVLNEQGDELADNIHLQIVDLEQPRLGLTETDFLRLGNEVDVIIHNAANTSVMRDYQSLRAANALCTRELIQLASIKQIPFHLISTVALANQDPISTRPQLPEDFVPQHPLLRDGYQQSKWVAEQIAAIAREKGYAINVYRLARVTGAQDSAYVSQKDLVWSILQAGLPLGILPELGFEEPWTPVDTLAQFIVQHSLQHPNTGVLNLAPANNVAIRQVYQWLAQAGQAFAVIPLAHWCAEIKKIGHAQHQPIAEFFLQNLATQDTGDQQGLPLTPYIHHQKFDQAAAELNLQLPVINQALFNRYFTYAAARGWFAATKPLAIFEQSPALNTQARPTTKEQVL
ncbi:non-ribosomal peptide synthetase [Cellvibrio sp. OA-2007]|uniref:non-ribosomal peptide synthetase n=1 Tax=Cellvibrio sp. OA-2007 TaxID=529823 RepID=UPI00078491D5|nr:non-ribosomal peptide synthetase [Cellvibrio sp. OA-2007]